MEVSRESRIDLNARSWSVSVSGDRYESSDAACDVGALSQPGAHPPTVYGPYPPSALGRVDETARHAG